MTDAVTDAAQRLRQLDVCEIAPGLTDAEFTAVESTFGFTFGDDHRAFLAAGLPLNRPGFTGWGFPDWRGGDPQVLTAQAGWAVEGVLLDVEGGVWPSSWGRRPRRDALGEARRRLAGAPRMVPVYGHRYLPGIAGTSGFPVLSIHATDIIFYGLDLADWVELEFGRAPRHTEWPAAEIPFWSALVS